MPMTVSTGRSECTSQQVRFNKKPEVIADFRLGLSEAPYLGG
jgi:hypothetical protein